MDDEERKARDQQLRSSIHTKLIESGEYERLKEMLKQKLVDSGWREDLKQYTMSACRPTLHLITPLATCLPRLHSRRSLPNLPPLTIPALADLIRTKGDEQLTVEQLTQEITPQGRATVPDEVKAELLLRIRRFVEEQAV